MDIHMIADWNDKKQEVGGKKQGKCGRGLPAGICLFLCVFLLTGIRSYAKSEASFTFFYLNACASCDDTEELMPIIREEILPDKPNMPYTISYYNIFRQQELEAYEKTLKKLGLSKEEAPVPLLVLEDRTLSGYDQIREGVKAMLSDYYKETALPETDDSTGSKPSSHGTEPQTPETPRQIQISEGEAWLFTTNNCKDCEKVKKELEQNSSSYLVVEKNILEEEHFSSIRTLFEYYSVPSGEQKVPVLFTSTGYAAGEDKIRKFLRGENAMSQAGNDGTLMEDYNSPDKSSYKDTRQSEEKISGLIGSKGGFWQMAGIGLVNGLNPCALSMLFFLLSILAGSGRKVLLPGVAYLAGKWIAYFGMGLGIFGFLGWSQGEWEGGMSFLGILMPVVAGLLAIMNLLDFLHVRKKEFGKIKVQLPERLRKWNHKKIREWVSFGEKGRGKVLIAAILLLSIVISAGEFFCTGQIYAASLYMLAREGGLSFLLILRVAAYVTALCLPSLAILLFVHKTGNLISASDGLLRFLPLIKLIYSLLFLLFAVYMLIAL